MRYIKKLFEKERNKLKGKQWYNQRFDGCPYFLHFVAESEISYDKEKKKGMNFTKHFCLFENNKADWYILVDDMTKISKKLFELGKKDPKISEKLIKQWQPQLESFYKKCFEIKKIDLSKLSDEELIKLHDEFSDIYLKKFSKSSIIDGFALGTDEFIANKILGFLKERGLQEKYHDIFSKLTAPVHQSFINEAEVSLFKIASKINKATPIKQLIIKNNSNNILKTIKQKYPKIHTLLKKHEKNYFWTKNNYVADNILTKEHFIKEIKDLFKYKIDPNLQINKIINTPKNNKKIKEKLMQDLRLDKELKILIKISEDLTYWQDERKKSSFWATHYFSLVLKEISRRVKIPLELIKQMAVPEVSNIFNKRPKINELQKRLKKSVFYWNDIGVEALTGETEDKTIKLLLGHEKLDGIKEIKGLCASIGKVIGKVKVCKSVTEISKVKQGDILVAIMTRPDYVIAMKKASAIITEEGGITSHAAIVSRELGIPCIIGTKIATKVLKDGMEVEVDADNGIIKIIKKG